MRNQLEVNLDEFRVGPSEVDSPVVVTGYTLGAREIDPTDKTCVAKTSFDQMTKRSNYWVKRCTNGADAGRMFNHTSPMFESATMGRIFDHSGSAMFEFKPVSRESFAFYLDFLRTENPIFLANAEREV